MPGSSDRGIPATPAGDAPRHDATRRRLVPGPSGVLAAAVIVGSCTAPTEAGDEPPGPSAIAPVADCALPPVPTSPTFQYALDVTYYSPGGTPVQLDIAWPTAAPRGATRPIVAYVHGGAWREGSPHQYLEEMVRLAGQGYIAASIGYRLVPAVRFPAPVADVACAIRFLRVGTTALGADTSRILTIGQSAGGQIASLLATDRSTTYDPQCPYVDRASAGVVGFVGVSGAYDLSRESDFSTVTNGEIAALLGASPHTVPATAAAASAVAHVDAGDPPTLLVHGTRDDVVPLRQARQMLATLRAANVPSTLVEVSGAKHDLAPLDTAKARRTASCTVWSFIRARLGTPSP